MTARFVEFAKVDRHSWGSGQWDDEPDIIRWIDPKTSRHCQIERAPSGHLCGYVAVEQGHPWFQVDEHLIEPHPEVHGGLTYASFKDGNPSHWWFGFDCAHIGDSSPSRNSGYSSRGATYKDVSFVTSECERLALQINEAGQ